VTMAGVLTIGIVCFEATRSLNVATDGLPLYAAGKAVLSGHGGLVYDEGYLRTVEKAGDPGFTGSLPYLNPPGLLAVIVPLALLPWQGFSWAWTGLSLLCFAGGVVLVARRPWQSRVVMGTLWAAVSLPVLDCLLAGQTDGLCVLMLGGCWWFWEKGRSFAAAALLGLCAGVTKPQLLIPLILFVVAGQGLVALRGMLVGGAVAAVIGMVFGGGLLASFASGMTGSASNHLPRFLSGFVGLASLILPSPSGALLLSAPLMVASWGFAWRLGRRGVSDRATALLLLLGVGILASPHSLGYDVSLLVLPIGILVSRVERGARYGLIWLLLGVAVAVDFGVAQGAIVPVHPIAIVLIGLCWSLGCGLWRQEAIKTWWSGLGPWLVGPANVLVGPAPPSPAAIASLVSRPAP
jgi:hypothetical protein